MFKRSKKKTMGCKPSSPLADDTAPIQDDSSASSHLSKYQALHGGNKPSIDKHEVSDTYIRHTGNSTWPIHNFVPAERDGLWINANAGRGGCTILTLMSCAYGGPGEDTTSEVKMVRCGFEGNHVDCASIANCHAGHFGANNGFQLDETGRLHARCLFGTNDVAFLSNDQRYGSNRCVYIVDGQEEASKPVSLHLKADGNACGEYGNTTALVLCSGTNESEDGNVCGVFMLRTGYKDKVLQAKCLVGSEEYKFSVKHGVIMVAGVRCARYGVIQNRYPKNTEFDKNSDSGAAACGSRFAKSSDNGGKCLLWPPVAAGTKHATFVVLCSESFPCDAQNTQATHSASYVIFVDYERKVPLKKACLADIGGGEGQPLASSWLFKLADGQLTVKTRNASRFAVFANVAHGGEDRMGPPTSELAPLSLCYYTSVMGSTEISAEGGVAVAVSAACTVVVQLDGQSAATVAASDRGDTSSLAFTIPWKTPLSQGAHIVRVFAVSPDERDKNQRIELKGSPKYLMVQPPGVLWTVNACGPDYVSSHGIVYESEFGRYVNYNYNFGKGVRWKCFCDKKNYNSVYHVVLGTDDTFLGNTFRSTEVEEITHKLHYAAELQGQKGKPLVCRIISICLNAKDRNMSLSINGDSGVYKKYMLSALKETIRFRKEHGEDLVGFTWSCDVPFTAKSDRFEMICENWYLCAFAVVTADYKDKALSDKQKAEEMVTKVKLSQETTPLSRTLLRRSMKATGWSPNLLKNASGEGGNMSFWTASGDWVVQEGGYETEKRFVTSHMECTKYQEVNLLECGFTESYLDSAQPEIQVSEWHREGCCGGGYYTFSAALLNAKGKPIKKFGTPTGNNIYRDSKWEKREAIFSAYGAGVRKVGLTSSGKDDKHWAGSYGAMMSNAVIRVKLDATSVEGDSYADIVSPDGGDSSAEVERLIRKILADNQALVKETKKEIRQIDDVAIKQFRLPDKHNQPIEPKRIKQKKKRFSQREIRVFVSSTFRDFRKEREELVLRTFKEVNQMCAERGVFFSYVDLRWGITEEQTIGGKTLAICLQEIEKCRPYFLCMVGNRYGWSQKGEDHPDELLDSCFNYAVEQFPKTMAWVDEHRYGSSVTQLEILHACLNDVEKYKARSFFYIRDSVDGLPDLDDRTKSAYTSESDWHQAKQDELRESLLKSPDLNTRQYSKVDVLCEALKADLIYCLDQDFPKGTELTQLEQARSDHHAFGNARVRVYIENPDYYNRLNAYMESSTKQPLVVLGESGSGKSALLANWAFRYEDAHPEQFVFMHFIGSSTQSAHYIKMIRRCCEEIKDHFGIEMEIASTDDAVIRDFPIWLQQAGRYATSVIVLDALNQLNDGQGLDEGAEHDLGWIPSQLPPNVFMIMSTLPGRAYNAVKLAGWESFPVSGLVPEQKQKVVQHYVEMYGKTMTDAQVDTLVNSKQTNNALYLKTLLDELRIFGNFKLLDKKIAEYLMSNTPAELFERILERLERDFEKGPTGTPDIVRLTTTALWCAKKGMTEAELRDYLNVPSAFWSPFYLSLLENLVNRDGILNFFHDHLRKAVQRLYLKNDAAKKAAFEQLASYFEKRNIMDERMAQEQPHLLLNSGQQHKLEALVSNIEFFHVMFGNEDTKFDLIKIWSSLGGFERCEAAYLPAAKRLQNDVNATGLIRDLAIFFIDVGLLSPARSLLTNAVDILEKTYYRSHLVLQRTDWPECEQSWCFKCNHPDVLEIFLKLGDVCAREGEYNKANEFYLEACNRIIRPDSSTDKMRLCRGLLGLGTVHYLQLQMDQAKRLLVKSRELATEVFGARHHFVASIIDKLGQLTMQQARPDQALLYFLQDLNLTRTDVDVGHPRLAYVLNNVGMVYAERNDAEAADIFEQALRILLTTYGDNHIDVGVVRYNLGTVYLARKFYQRARFQFERALQIFQMFLGDDHENTKSAIEGVASIK